MVTLKKVFSHYNKELGLSTTTYTANGYDIKVSNLMGERNVTFTGIKGVYQPSIVLNGGDEPYLDFSGSVFLCDIEIFSKQVLEAKELAIFIKEHLNEL